MNIRIPVLAAATTILLSGCFDKVQYENASVDCYDGQCPEGQTCGTDGVCYDIDKIAECLKPSSKLPCEGAGGAAGAAGSGGVGGNTSTAGTAGVGGGAGAAGNGGVGANAGTAGNGGDGGTSGAGAGGVGGVAGSAGNAGAGGAAGSAGTGGAANECFDRLEVPTVECDACQYSKCCEELLACTPGEGGDCGALLGCAAAQCTPGDDECVDQALVDASSGIGPCKDLVTGASSEEWFAMYGDEGCKKTECSSACEPPLTYTTCAGQFSELVSTLPVTTSYGASVAIRGDYVVVGAPGSDVVAVRGGAAAVFKRSTGAWAEQDVLAPATLEASEGFGLDVAFAGTSILVTNSAPTGTVYRYEQVGNDWQVAEDFAITASSIAGDDGIAVVGAAEGVGGKAYVLEHDSPNWTLTPLPLPTLEFGDGYGTAVAVSGGTVFVLAPFYEEGDKTGAVFVYEKSGPDWKLVQTLSTATGGVDEPVQGISPYGAWLAADGGTLFTTTHVEKLIPWGDDTGAWKEETALTASSIERGYARFGQGVSADGGQVAYGLRPNNDGFWVGVANKSDGAWSETCRAKWSGLVDEPIAGGHAGLPVGISGSRIVHGGLTKAVVLELD